MIRIDMARFLSHQIHNILCCYINNVDPIPLQSIGMRAAINGYLIMKGKHQLQYLVESLDDPMKHNTELLFYILKDNADTEYGLKNHFKDIKTIEDYQKLVPLTDYSDYRPLIERMMAGEQLILTAENPIHYSVSSGTTGPPKFIPLTPKGEQQRDYFGLIMAVCSQHVGEQWTSGTAVDISEAQIKDLPTGATVGVYSARLIKKVGPVLSQLNSTPLSATYPIPGTDCTYLQARYGLADKETTRIGGYFMNVVLNFFQYIQANWEQLVKDIELGELSKTAKIPDQTREELLKTLKPNPDRAAELKEIFSKGFAEPFAVKVWPKLTYITGAGGGSFKIHVEQIKKRYVGYDVKMNFCLIVASEADIGIMLDMESHQAALLAKHTFFEFKLAHDPNAPLVTMDKLQYNEEYEVVITSCAGFYRYRLSDVLLVSGMRGKTPLVEFVQRAGCVLNLSGEKTSDSHAQEAVSLMAKDMKMTVTDFSVRQTDTVPGTYVFYVEPHSSEGKIDVGYARQLLEKYIYYVNVRAAPYFAKGLIAPIYLNLLKSGAYDLFKTLRMAQGASANQCKPPRMLTGSYVRFMELVGADSKVDVEKMIAKVKNGEFEDFSVEDEKELIGLFKLK